MHLVTRLKIMKTLLTAPSVGYALENNTCMSEQEYNFTDVFQTIDSS